MGAVFNRDFLDRTNTFTIVVSYEVSGTEYVNYKTVDLGQKYLGIGTIVFIAVNMHLGNRWHLKPETKE